MKHGEETEELKKKMLRSTAESEDQIEAAQARAHATEKQKHKAQMDIDALNKELEIANNNTLSADRRVKELEKQISGRDLLEEADCGPSISFFFFFSRLIGPLAANIISKDSPLVLTPSNVF